MVALTKDKNLFKLPHIAFLVVGFAAGIWGQSVLRSLQAAETSAVSPSAIHRTEALPQQKLTKASDSSKLTAEKLKLKTDELNELQQAYDEVSTRMNYLQYALFKSFENTTALKNKYKDLAYVLELPESKLLTFSNSVLPTQVKANTYNLLLDSIPLNNVVDEKFVISSGYGARDIKSHPSASKFHKAVDFDTPIGTPIFAPANAVVDVIRPSTKSTGSGNFIRLAHAYGFATSYSHLEKFNVKRGQFIQKGEVIGWTGNTGLTTGPHLHYEVIFLNKKLNPEAFLAFNKEPSWDNLTKIKGVPWEQFEVAMKDSSMRSALVFR